MIFRLSKKKASHQLIWEDKKERKKKKIGMINDQLFVLPSCLNDSGKILHVGRRNDKRIVGSDVKCFELK